MVVPNFKKTLSDPGSKVKPRAVDENAASEFFGSMVVKGME